MASTAPVRRTRATRRYARPNDLKLAVAAARESGLIVTMVEMTPDGLIRLVDRGPAPAETLFDAWDQANKL